MTGEDRAARGLKGLLSLIAILIAVAWAVRHYRPKPAVAGDPVQSIRAARARTRSLPWEDVDVDRLGPACDAGDRGACTTLGQQYEGLRNAVEDFGFKLPTCVEYELYQRGCEDRWGEPDACYRLGVYEREGRCGDRDPERARMLFDDSCRRGLQSACTDLAALDD